MASESDDRAQRLHSLRDQVFAAWLNAVRQRVQQAHRLPSAVLIDTLPVFYEQLCAAVTNVQAGSDQSTLASEHGGERARLTRYDVEMVAHEFQLFRTVVFQTWEQAGIVLALAEALRVNALIDEAIRESITGFVMAEAAAREQFFSALAHDLRTPLSTATMAVDLINQSTDPAAIRELAALAARQHERIGAMVAELLDQAAWSAVQRGDLALQRMDLGALVHDIIGCSALATARQIDVDAPPLEGWWHRDALRRAIENLLSNAVKYSAPGSAITVRLASYGGRATLSVANVGPPIPPEQVEAIFQLFRRAALKGETGWGIGLPYVRSVAEQHGGSVSVDSGAERTTFTLDIPVDPRPVLAARPAG